MHNPRTHLFESAKKYSEGAYDFKWEEYQEGVMGGFMKKLAGAFDEADTNNLAKLAEAFPDVYKVYAEYHGDVLHKF